MTINVQTLGEATFYYELSLFLGQFEGNIPEPYYDSKGIPTIGIGKNLTVSSQRKAGV